MANFSIKIDNVAFKKKFAQYIDSDRRIKAAIDKFAKKIFLRAHDSLMKDFDQHPITKELKEGPTGANISGTLGGYGNLFAFLGFFDDQKPTEELETMLNRATLERTIRRGNHVYYRVNMPDKSEIESATQLNWGSGTSWAYAVETGNFDGNASLSHFIYKSWDGSRSEEGLQVEGEYREEEFKEMPYITKILDNFRNRINQV